MEKLKFGILGVSNHFLKRIILPLKECKHCMPYAIASRNPDKAKEIADKFDIPVAIENYQELLETPGVNAIYIPLPNHLHFDWTIKSIKQGTPVLCEKPLAMNFEEAQTMAEISSSNNIPLMEGFMYKFHPMWIHVKNIIKTNQIGNITYINSSFSYNNPSASNIRNIKEYGGGALMDIGCYTISVPRFLLDKEPKKVVSLISRHPDFDTDMHTSAIMDFGDTRATFNVSTLSQPFQTVDIIGTGGSITVHIPFNTYVDTKSYITVNTSQGSRKVEFTVEDAYKNMFDQFAYSIINQKEMPLSLDDSVKNAKVTDAVLKSAETGKWVNIE
ncbi:Gfo/Idh/MocA family oxidoreductase [Marinilabiliaceae bacterium ANBcel2]|nr:Gfo/Idh/MocA family oxidoreductase [Marinilabiliaceae bacterium ANBcel2]